MRHRDKHNAAVGAAMQACFKASDKLLTAKEASALPGFSVRSQTWAQLEPLQREIEKTIRKQHDLEGILQLLGTPTKSVLLGSGVYGVSLLVRWPGCPVPLVAKLSLSHVFSGCLPESSMLDGGTVCAVMDGHREEADGSLFWAPAHVPAYEHLFFEVVRRNLIDSMATPHLPYVFFSATFDLGRGARTVEQLLRDPRNRVDMRKGLSRETGHNLRTTKGSVSLVLLEYVGMRLADLMRSCVLTRDVAFADLVFRSMVCQVLQGLLALQSVGLRHNDLHSNNVVGAPTAATHLLYFVKLVVDDDHDVEPRVFRVPTAGMVWRIIDYGGVSADSSTGNWPDSAANGHGVFNRFHFGGPTHDMFPRHYPEILPTPLEAFDIVRVASTTGLEAKGVRGPAAAHVARLSAELIKTATSLGQGRGRRAANAGMSVREAGKLRPVTIEDLAKPGVAARVLREVERLQRASQNTLLLWDMFCEVARSSGMEVTGTALAEPQPGDDTYSLSIPGKANTALAAKATVAAVKETLSAAKDLSQKLNRAGLGYGAGRPRGR